MIWVDFFHETKLGGNFYMENTAKPSCLGSTTPALEGAPVSASHPARSISVTPPTPRPLPTGQERRDPHPNRNLYPPPPAGAGSRRALAQRLGHDPVGSEHLLLGLLQDRQSGAGRLLAAQGLTRQGLLEQLTEAWGTGALCRGAAPSPPSWSGVWRPP